MTKALGNRRFYWFTPEDLSMLQNVLHPGGCKISDIVQSAGSGSFWIAKLTDHHTFHFSEGTNMLSHTTLSTPILIYKYVCMIVNK